MSEYNLYSEESNIHKNKNILKVCLTFLLCIQIFNYSAYAAPGGKGNQDSTGDIIQLKCMIFSVDAPVEVTSEIVNLKVNKKSPVGILNRCLANCFAGRYEVPPMDFILNGIILNEDYIFEFYARLDYTKLLFCVPKGSHCGDQSTTLWLAEVVARHEK